MAVDTLGPVLQSLLASAASSLQVGVGRSFIQPGGEVAWDDCCSGQLWVRVIEVFPHYTGAGRTVVASRVNCGPEYMTVTVGVGVIRCVSTVDDRGNAPKADALTHEALDMTRDYADLYAGIMGLAWWNDEQRLPEMGRWNPLGALGGCAGGEWTVKFKLTM